MGRNSKSSKCNPVCEKLFKALSGYPKFIKFRPNRQEEPKPAAPVGLAHAREDIVAPKMDKIQKQQIQIIGGEKKSGEDVNDVFSDYISRAKRRLGSISIKRHDSDNRGKENVKDDQRFSDYVIRAKNKLRATSSNVGWSKGSSIKPQYIEHNTPPN